MKQIWYGKNKWITIGIGTFLILAGVYFGFAIYYLNHFYQNTNINGVNCSKMTVSSAKAEIEKEGLNYALTLEERIGKEEIKGSDVGFSVVMDETHIQDALRSQKPFLWLFKVFGTHELSAKPKNTNFDQTKLMRKVASLSCFEKTMTRKPKDAYISSYSEEGFKIIPEDLGTKVIRNTLKKAVLQAFTNMNDKLNFENANCYEKPSLYANSPTLNKTVKTMNKYGKTKVTYLFGDKTEVVDGHVIQKWLKVDRKGNVTLKLNRIQAYVNFLGSKYNTLGATRKFKTHSGKVVNVKGGSYGWWINTDREAKNLKKLVERGATKKKEPSYRQKAAEHGSLDIGKTYVEINIGAQHLYFYKNGKMICESDFVSGNLSLGHGTPNGTYSLMYKESPSVLRGDDYATDVTFWMPFNNNIGMHDASWRHGRFGGSIYKTNGSHGCVNLPYEAAQKIYKNITPNTAIVCFNSPGAGISQAKLRAQQKAAAKKAAEAKKKAAAKKKAKKKAND